MGIFGSKQFVFILIVYVVSCVPSVWAQEGSVFGYWEAPHLGAKLLLNNNGTFLFTGSQGMNSGKFGIQGNTLWMSDSYGQAYYYQIRALTDSALLLLDGTGNPINYTRAGENNTPISEASVSSDMNVPGASERSAGKTLASAQGKTLTRGMVDTAIDFIQFIAGQPIKDSEKKGYVSAAIMEFQKEPVQYVKDIEAVSQAMKKVKTLTNPVAIGAVRQAFIGGFHKATSSMEESTKPASLRIINRYVPVVAFSPNSGLALTKKDLESALDYLEFCHKSYCELNKVDVPVTKQKRNWAKMQMKNTFPLMAIQQQQFMVSASLIWKLMKAQWDRLTVAQKHQVKGQMASPFPTKEALEQQATSATYTSQGTANSGGYQKAVDSTTGASPASGGTMDNQYQNTGSYSGGQKKSMAQMQREFNANQACLNMMNNTALGTHATMLNTIENFGDTGNYWKVVDY